MSLMKQNDSEKDKKKRPPPVSYRPPEELREAFAQRVQDSGLNTSAYITRAVFGQEPGKRSRRPPIEQKLLAKLLAETAQIRTQLDEIMLTGVAQNTAQHGQLLEVLQDIRAALLHGMGRKP
jgi:hypothetical protein